MKLRVETETIKRGRWVSRSGQRRKTDRLESVKLRRGKLDISIRKLRGERIFERENLNFLIAESERGAFWGGKRQMG